MVLWLGVMKAQVLSSVLSSEIKFRRIPFLSLAFLDCCCCCLAIRTTLGRMREINNCQHSTAHSQLSSRATSKKKHFYEKFGPLEPEGARKSFLARAILKSRL
jgi:hypothetical protein